MKYIKSLKELNKEDVGIAGGKGASLGEMINSNIPVPEGFVIISSCFELFLKESNLSHKIDELMDRVKSDNIKSIDIASKKIQNLIKNAKMPEKLTQDILKNFVELNTEYVAVRSSATAEDGSDNAWAGQLDSFLNTKEKDILEKVHLCWASLFTPRAIFYRLENGMQTTKISVAVVVQKMVNSKVSGIAFSVHPILEDRNQIVIEAGFGLGETIVSGQITPDSYVTSKKQINIISVNISPQTKGLYRSLSGGNEWKNIYGPKASSQKLTNDQIIALTNLVINIENHYGFPCDIEWALEKDKFYIVQSRPITTLKVKNQADQFLDKKWTKIWTTEYSLFSVWLFGREYIEDCKQELGFGFDDIVFLIEGDLATIFRDNTKQEEFVKYLANKSLLDKSFKDRCLKQYYKLHHGLSQYIKLPPNKGLNIKNLHRLIELHRKFIAYFLVPLWSPNGFAEIDVSDDYKKSVFKEYEEARKSTENTYPKLEKYLKTLFQYIAKKEKIAPTYLTAILPNELLEYSKSNKLPPLDLLKERHDYCVLLSNKEGNKLVVGDKARTIIEKISAIDTAGIMEINGTIANKGRVTGLVRKIFREKDMKTFQTGEILVTTMTRPEWLPIMKKASGFITDAGGILSHAAIVARELNKPCIIGTKIATQVFKNGDMVELDANNGIVKLLK